MEAHAAGYGTELDLAPPAAYCWLAANADRFHFVKRYAWGALALGVAVSPQIRVAAARVRVNVATRYRRGRFGIARSSP